MGGDGSLNLYKYNNSDFYYDEFDNNKNEKSKITLLNSNIICTQPIIGFDWHYSKFGLSSLVAFDNTIKICNMNKIN